jgi:hypothetical protein
MDLNNCILTYTGQYVNLVDPDPATINVTDIAHAPQVAEGLFLQRFKELAGAL